MMSAASLGDTVRAAIACFRAVDRSAAGVYVFLEEPRRQPGDPLLGQPERTVPRRYLLRRLYIGEHKSVAGHHTILVGYELSADPVQLVTLPQRGSLEVVVRGRPPEGVDAVFEGVFDLRALDIPRSA